MSGASAGMPPEHPHEHPRLAVGRHMLRAVVFPGALLYLALVACGLLLAHPFAGLIAGEDEVNRDLVDARTADWNTVTDVISTLADTASIIGSLLAFALFLRLAHGRWGEAVTLMTAVLLEASVFLLTALVIDRPRPSVPQLDIAPPTSSFPSGHTGAAVALYGGLAVVAGWRMRRVVPRVLLISALVSLPVLVAVCRLYRGMHHPSDVVFGALNGLACLAIAVRALGPGGHAAPDAGVKRLAWTQLPRLPGPRSGSPSSRTGASPSAEA